MCTSKHVEVIVKTSKVFPKKIGNSLLRIEIHSEFKFKTNLKQFKQKKILF